MWWTSEGERVLSGAEWELFRTGLACVWHYTEDSVKNEPLFSSGIAAFDDLQPEQKLALLALVGKALSDENVAMPELTSHAEATVAAVFEYIRQSIELEIGSEDQVGIEAGRKWRKRVLAACRELDEKWEDPLPEPSCEDPDEWGVLVDVLAEWILWDYDFDMEDTFLDGEPDVVRPQMKAMGISKNYFLRTAPDPTVEEMKCIRDTLREVTGKS